MDSNKEKVINVNFKKLRILYISSDKYPPYRVDSSVLFGEEMVNRGHIIDWILQSEQPCNHPYKTEWHGSSVWVGKMDDGITRLSRLKKHVYCITHQLKMFSLLKANDYDILQVKNKYLIAIAALIASRIYKIKFTYWLSYPHAEEALYKYKEGIARYPIFYFIKGHVLAFLLYKIIMPFADHIFVQSEKMKNDIALLGVPKEKMTPIPMGVSIKSFEQYSELCSNTIPPIDTDKKTIVYLGTIQRARKMDFMVRVLGYVIKEASDSKLYIVGDGDSEDDRISIENIARDIGVSSSLVITGFLPRIEAMKYVYYADVCVSPFCPSPILDSTSPTKLIEYMAMGKAVVANSHPEQQLILDKSGGGVCVPYEEKAFAKAIIGLLKNPEKAKEMGAKGKRFVKKYRDYQKIADFLENVYYQSVI